ncbi:MAG: methyltransferase domain-containing protein [Acidobacteriota bacterium]|nr:methyltransferase domain-containing protein [Acidobacteriota bacterium]
MNKSVKFLLAAFAVIITLALAPVYSQITPQPRSGQPTPSPTPVRRDVPYVPTSPEVVSSMLKMANVTKNDVVYDLGCGDGRIVVSAVKDFGAKRGVGVDIDPERIKEAKHNARRADVTNKVTFIEGDLFKTDLREATVVTLYLLPAVNLRLLPKLLEELKPGTRVVSHAFDMGDWTPEKTETVNGSTIYFWTIPKDKTTVPTVRVFRGDDQ